MFLTDSQDWYVLSMFLKFGLISHLKVLIKRDYYKNKECTPRGNRVWKLHLPTHQILLQLDVDHHHCACLLSSTILQRKKKCELPHLNFFRLVCKVHHILTVGFKCKHLPREFFGSKAAEKYGTKRPCSQWIGFWTWKILKHRFIISKFDRLKIDVLDQYGR